MSISTGWGPWTPGLEPVERIARLRCLRAIYHLALGPAAERLTSLLSMAEADDAALDAAAAALDQTPSRDRRRMIAHYGSVTCPNWRS